MPTNLIDTVAKAIRDNPNQPCGMSVVGEMVFCDDERLGHDQHRECVCKSNARAAIAAIDASGTHRVLPVEATDYMQQAAFDVLFGAVVSSANLQPMWDAMLAAIPKGDALDDE